MKAWLAAVTLFLLSTAPVRGDAADRYGDPLPAGAIARLGTTRWRTGACNHVEYTADGKSILTSYLNFASIYSGSERDVVRQWDRATSVESKRWLLPQTQGRSRIIAFNGACGLAVAYRQFEVIEVIRLRDGAVLFSTKEQGLDTAALSPDGRILGTWNDHSDTLTLWDLEKRAKRWTISAAIKDGKRRVRAFPEARLLFSPDGRLVTLRAGRYGADDREFSMVHVWDLSDGKEVLRETINEHWLEDIAFSPDSATLAWNTATGITVQTLHKKEQPRHLKMARSGESFFPFPYLAFSPDGQTLAAAIGTKLTLWDLARNKSREMASSPQDIWYLAFAPDGKELAGAGRTSLSRWDIATGKLRESPGKVTQAVREIAFAGQGKVYTAASDAFTAWDPHTGREILSHPLRRTTHLKIAPDGKNFAVVETDNKIVCRDIVSGRVVQSHSFAEEVKFFDFTGQDQGLMAVTDDGKVHYRIPGKENKSLPLALFKENRFANVYASQGRFAVNAAWAGNGFPTNGWRNPLPIPFVDVARAQPLPAMKLTAKPETSFEPIAAMFAPDQRSLALGAVLMRDEDRTNLRNSQTRFFLMERATGLERFRFNGWDNMTTWMMLATNGRFIAIADMSDHHARPITVWDAVRGKIVARFQQPNNVTCLAFSADGARLASGLNDGTALIWDLAKFSERPIQKLGDNELATLWKTLASTDAREAFLAIHAMAAARDQAPAFLRALLPLPNRATSKQIDAWIAELEDNAFAKREKARRHLAELGNQAEVALRAALAYPRGLEMQRRIQALLSELKPLPRGPQELQKLRAMEVLELIGSRECAEILEEQAARAPEAWRAEEAHYITARMQRDRR